MSEVKNNPKTTISISVSEGDILRSDCVVMDRHDPQLKSMIDDMIENLLDSLTLHQSFPELAKQRGVPGPDVKEHPENYDGECYCRTCLSYMD